MTTATVRSYIRDDVETIPRQEMNTLQADRLRAGIERLSKTVPFYREKLSQAGVSTDDIRSVEDLSRLPS